MKNKYFSGMELSWLAVLAICWLVFAGLLTLLMWPDLPRKDSQWLLLITLGPPVFVFGEAIFSWLLSPKHGMFVSRSRFSVLRILIAFPLALGWFVLCWWFARLISS